MKTLANHTALKEWASVIAALRSGAQILLVRKGGIADPSFGLEADAFYLFPTYLHQGEKRFRPEFAHLVEGRDREPETVLVDTWCEVGRVFRVTDLAALRRLAPFVIFSEETFDERFRFRPDQAVHVLCVLAHRLARPVEVTSRSEYAGCRSWISLAEEIDVTGSHAVMADGEWAARVAEVERTLAGA